MVASVIESIACTDIPRCPDRVRAWAKAKAHGPSALLPDAREVTGGPAHRNSEPSNTAPATGPVADGSEQKPSADTTTPSPEKPLSKRAARANKNVAVRFFLTVKDILLSSYINILLVFVPVGIAVNFSGASGGIVFAMNAIAIIPLAGLLSQATESVAMRLGDTIGALMNVTFGNAVELIIFIIALVKNEIRIVQASILGSILANLLLILGMCFLFGGLRFREQIYNSTVTQMSACLLSLAVTSLLLPTAFHASFNNTTDADTKVLQVSRGTSVVLLLVYILYLLFQLNSHSYMYESTPQHIIEAETHPGPGAQFWNTSSSSESSSSSSSDSDSDGSSHSGGTRRKIKKMMRKGRKHRKSSAASDLASGSNSTENDPSTVAHAGSVAPELQGTQATDHAAAGTYAILPDVVAVVTDDATADAGDELAAEQPKQKKHKHKRKHGHRHRRESEGKGELEPTQPGPAHDAQVNGMDRRVEFALAQGQDVEAQPETVRTKPFALRLLRPTVSKSLSQNVFQTPSQQSPNIGGAAFSDPAQFQFGLRRTNSLPLGNQRGTYRSSPGMLPPIVPIVVNSTPKTKTAEEEEQEEPEISRTTAILLLLCSTGLVALCAEFMVSSINEVVSNAGPSGYPSEAFIGLIILPIVGNAAEHVTAVTVAMKNKMDLALGVALGSSIQIALFVTPLVVIIGWIMNKDMSLYFTLFETVSMFVSAFIVNFLVLDGRSNYLEGALLCSAYVIIAVAAFFFPNGDSANSLGGGEDGNNATVAIVTGAKLLVREVAAGLL
jgi:Ca2+:H+ antiporter